MERKKPFPVGRALEGKNVVQVSCGGMHTVALTDKGKVGCEGWRCVRVWRCVSVRVWRCVRVSSPRTCMCVNPRCFIVTRVEKIQAAKRIIAETDSLPATLGALFLHKDGRGKFQAAKKIVHVGCF